MTSRRGRAPRVTEIAEAMGIGVEDVVEGLEAARAHYSLSLDDRGAEAHAQAPALGETLGREDPHYESVETRLTLIAGIRTLPFQERRAVVLRLSQDLKQADIARRMGCSQMQVSRLLRRAATRLT
jgi:RNA polymerase sigma-B factor